MKYNNATSGITNESFMFKIGLVAIIATSLLTGCSFDFSQMAGSQMSESDSKSIGAACRQSKRGLEACFEKNPKAMLSSVHEGWLEMDAYVREHGEPSFISEIGGLDLGSSETEGQENETSPDSGGFLKERGEASPSEERFKKPVVRASRWVPTSASTLD